MKTAKYWNAVVATGVTFRSRRFVRAFDRHRMAGSIGSVGVAGDNAAMESFFSLLQKNVLDGRAWVTREELRITIVSWIERTCPQTLQTSLTWSAGPVDFETVMTPPALRPRDRTCHLNLHQTPPENVEMATQAASASDRDGVHAVVTGQLLLCVHTLPLSSGPRSSKDKTSPAIPGD